MLKKGFVTIATGDARYYKMAYNLLLSYRFFSINHLPFCLICDSTNEYTSLFDDVVLLEKSDKSFLDKLRLPKLAPYDENIFIDADSLIYGNIDNLFNIFLDNDIIFSSFGTAHPIDSKNKGWFDYNGAGEFKDSISFLTGLHGGCYFIRKKPQLAAFCETVDYINKNFNNFKFTYPYPCDESIFALAMAVHNFKPVNNHYDINFIYYPRGKSKAKTINMLKYVRATIIHFGNINTYTSKYKKDVYILNDLIENHKPKTRITIDIKNMVVFLVKYSLFAFKKIRQKIYNRCKRNH